ncbi:UNVERIFIED_CONTAM: hypothetical protein FKN15_011802 [Acipenser sinensis]
MMGLGLVLRDKALRKKDELPQTVVVKDSVGVKEEPLSPFPGPDGDLRPSGDSLHPDVKPESPSQEEPCTKMTMRLRHNQSSTQIVSNTETHTTRATHRS